MNRVGEIVFGSAAAAGTILAGGAVVEAQQNEAAIVMDAPEMSSQFEVDGVILAIGELPSRVCILPNPNIPEGQPGWCNDWGPETPPTPEPDNPPSSGGGSSGGGNSGGGSGSGGGNGGGGSSGGGNSGGGSGSGGGNGGGGSSGGGNSGAAPAPARPSFMEVFVNANNEVCESSTLVWIEDSPYKSFLSPAETPDDKPEDIAVLVNRPELWTPEDTATLLDAARDWGEDTDEHPEGSKRLVELFNKCGFGDWIDGDEWINGLGRSEESYWEYVEAHHGVPPTELQAVWMEDPANQITANTPQPRVLDAYAAAVFARTGLSVSEFASGTELPVAAFAGSSQR